MGCQILDDMVDLGRRHARGNATTYVVSLIHHGEDDGIEKTGLARAMADKGTAHHAVISARHYPNARARAWETAHQSLRSGLESLFAPQDQMLVGPVIALMVKRIGAESLNRAKMS